MEAAGGSAAPDEGSSLGVTGGPATSDSGDGTDSNDKNDKKDDRVDAVARWREQLNGANRKKPSLFVSVKGVVSFSLRLFCPLRSDSTVVNGLIYLDMYFELTFSLVVLRYSRC